MITKEDFIQIGKLIKQYREIKIKANEAKNWKNKVNNLINYFLVHYRNKTLPSDTRYIPYKIWLFFNKKKVRIDFYLRKDSDVFSIEISWSLAKKLNVYDDELGNLKVLILFLDKIIDKIEKRCLRDDYLEGLLEGLKVLKEKTRGMKFGNFNIEE